MRVMYLAGPLFAEAERAWRRKSKHLLLEQASRRGRAGAGPSKSFGPMT